MKKAKRLILLATLCMAGCITPHGVAMTDVDPNSWSGASHVEWDNVDTLGRVNIDLVVRYTRQAKIDSLPMLITFRSPDGLTSNCKWVAYPTEQSPRSYTFGLMQCRLLNNAVMDKKGTYRFSFCPLATIEGVWSIGVDIEKAD